MDTSSVLIGLVLLLVSITPVILIVYQSNKNRKKIKRQLKSVAKRENSKMELIEIGKNFAIGVSLIDAKLFFVKAEEEGLFDKIIDLSLIRCLDYKKVRKGGELEAVELVFIYKSSESESFSLNSQNNDFQHGGELRIARSIADTVNSYLKEN